jgi:hypothetical protein
MRLECDDAEGKIRLAEGRPDEALVAMRRALAEAEAAPDQSNRDQAASMLAEALRATGDTRGAATLHREILARLDSSGYLDADAVESVASFVAGEMAELGELAELDSIARDLLRRQETLLGHGRTTAGIGFVHGLTLLRLGQLDSADAWLSRMPAHPNGALAGWLPPAIALLRLDQGRLAAARAAVATMPEDSPTRRANLALYRARLRRLAGDTAGARAQLAHSVDSALKAVPAGGRVPANLGPMLVTGAEWDLEASPKQAPTARRAGSGRGAAERSTAAGWLGTGAAATADSLARLARTAAAVDSLALRRSAHVARAEMALARARLALGDPAGARAAAERARVASAVGNGPEHPRTAQALALLDSLEVEIRPGSAD